jgi:hypothetical protein
VNRFLYLFLALCFITFSGLMFVLRPDLRRSLLVTAACGAVWGPISEYWFFMDYWRPLSVFRQPWLEDILYGAGIAASAANVYKFLSGKVLVETVLPRRLWIVPAFVVLYVASMFIFQGRLHYNSIYVSMLVYLALACLILIVRHDLVVPSVASSMIMAAIAAVGYGLGLNFLVDGHSVLREIWLLYGSSSGVTILGLVPLSEVAWYTCWGLLFGGVYEFATGYRVARVGVGLR